MLIFGNFIIILKITFPHNSCGSGCQNELFRWLGVVVVVLVVIILITHVKRTC